MGGGGGEVGEGGDVEESSEGVGHGYLLIAVSFYDAICMRATAIP